MQSLQKARQEYKAFQADAEAMGMNKKHFNQECKRLVEKLWEGEAEHAEPKYWLAAAERVLEGLAEYCHERKQEQASFLRR